MALNERDFFTEKPELEPMSLACPQCRHRADNQIKWVRRTKKDRIPPAPTSATARCAASSAITSTAPTTTSTASAADADSRSPRTRA